MLQALGRRDLALENYQRSLTVDSTNRIALNATRELRPLIEKVKIDDSEIPAHVILQPCANDDAQEHYRNTIQRPVPFTRIEQYLSPSLFVPLRRTVEEASIMTWGFTPGSGGRNIAKWNRIQPGDRAAFYARRWVFFVGRVCAKLWNAPLAKELWGFDEVGSTWELLYFLGTGKKADFPLKRLTDALGYPSDLVQSCRVCDATMEAIGVLNEA